MNKESVYVRTRYIAATVNHISNGLKVEVIISLPAFVRSVMEITETKDESFIREINWPAVAGSVLLIAWGIMICFINW